MVCNPALYNPVQVPRGRVFALFWFENGYRLRPFRSGIGYDFRGNYWSVWTYLSFLSQMNKKEREIHEYRRNGLKKSSLLVSNIGNDDIISWTPVRGQVWKRVWVLKAGQKKSVKSDIFWSEIGSGSGEPRDIPSPKIPRSTLIRKNRLLIESFHCFRKFPSLKRSFQSIFKDSSTEYISVLVTGLLVCPLHLRTCSQAIQDCWNWHSR